MKTELGLLVAKERKKLGYKQQEFCERVGVSLSFLRSLEQGKKSLRMDKVEEVLSFLGYQLKAIKQESL